MKPLLRFSVPPGFRVYRFTFLSVSAARILSLSLALSATSLLLAAATAFSTDTLSYLHLPNRRYRRRRYY